MRLVQSTSLASRLWRYGALWTAITLLLTAIVLSLFTKQAVEVAFDKRLEAYIKNLAADLATLETADEQPIGTFGEPRFELPLSGWYWVIERLDTISPPFTSRSLVDVDFPPTPLAETLSTERFPVVVIEGPQKQTLRVMQRVMDLGGKGFYRIRMGVVVTEIDQTVRQFQNGLAVAFLGLAFGLAMSSYMQVRAGLRPLQMLRAHVADLRQGHIRRLTGNQPIEVQPLIDEINALLEDNEAIIERARTHTGNLAHALKTPLSGLINEVTGLDLATQQKLQPSLESLQHTIQHHLEKARLAARSETRAYKCDLKKITDSLLRIFIKTNPHLGFHLEAAPELPFFAGEEQDAMDIIGNILENAAKWASKDINIVLTCQNAASSQPIINVIIDDDGPGLDEQQRQKLGQRGLRLDETKPGSGLGLSIVRDLLVAYKATWSLQTSPKGGLRVSIHLPAVESKSS